MARGARPQPTQNARLGFSGVILCEPWRPPFHEKTARRGERTKFAVGEGKTARNFGGPADGGPAKKNEKIPLLLSLKNERKNPKSFVKIKEI